MTNQPCKHLEKLLPHPNKGRIGPKMVAIAKHIENMPTLDPMDYEEKTQTLIQELRGLGVEDFRIKVLMDKFISNFSYEEIAANDGFVSAGAVRYLCKQTLALLKSRGFGARVGLI